MLYAHCMLQKQSYDELLDITDRLRCDPRIPRLRYIMFYEGRIYERIYESIVQCTDIKKEGFLFMFIFTHNKWLLLQGRNQNYVSLR